MPESSKKADYETSATCKGFFHYGNHVDLIDVGKKVNLVRNPDNPFDSNTIEIHTLNGKKLGYIASEDAARLAPEMDEGGQLTAIATSKRKVHLKKHSPWRIDFKISVQKGRKQKPTSHSPGIVLPPKPPITISQKSVSTKNTYDNSPKPFTATTTTEKIDELVLLESSTDPEHEFDVSCPYCNASLLVTSSCMGLDIDCPSGNENFFLGRTTTIKEISQHRILFGNTREHSCSLCYYYLCIK